MLIIHYFNDIREQGVTRMLLWLQSCLRTGGRSYLNNMARFDTFSGRENHEAQSNFPVGSMVKTKFNLHQPQLGNSLSEYLPVLMEYNRSMVLILSPMHCLNQFCGTQRWLELYGFQNFLQIWNALHTKPQPLFM